jgi:hypothetical protein
MNTVDLIQYSLGNAFGILGQVTADLSQEQADWTPPGCANPIGALYWHTLASVDQIVHAWGMGQAPLSQRADWQDKILVGAPPQEEPGRPPDMRGVRVDLPALHQYAQAVAQASQAWLAELTPEDLERELETPVGELNLGQMLEIFVIWHINAHCGEISALKGCQGAQGYPF